MVVYVPRDATPEAERSVLADAYRFILETEKKGGPATVPNDDPNEFSKGSGIAKRKREDRM